MRSLILILAFAVPLAAQQPQVDRGVFHIRSEGHEIGVESFKIAPAPEGIQATAELQMTVPGAGRMTETATLLLRGNLEPLKYERIQKAPKHGSASVVFAGEKASAHYKTSEGGVQDMDFYVPKSVVVLDTNFFHHYTFLVRHYDFVKGGAQHINVLVPQEAAPGMVRVEYTGNEGSLRKLVARTDELEIEIWADDAGQIQKLAVPAAKVEVTREQK